MSTLVPIFDLGERDRRWARLRKLMAADQVDCLIGFPNSGHWDLFQAGLRYVTQIGGNTTEVSVVFPLEGEVTAFVRGPNEVAWWGSQSEWIPDLRVTRRTWAPGVIERLRDLKLDSAHIGIIGLSGSPRSPEGLVASGIVDALREELPRAQFSSATDLVARARAVKSPAQIDFIGNARPLAQKAAQTLIDPARPRVP